MAALRLLGCAVAGLTGWRDGSARKWSLFQAAIQPLGWVNGEKNIIKGKKKSHFSRGIADFRSAPTPGDWISFFYFPLTCRGHYKTENTLASYYLALIDNAADT